MMYVLFNSNDKLISMCRDTETFESVTEDDQLPQIAEELHDVHVSPGAPVAKMQLKVKGTFMKQSFINY